MEEVGEADALEAQEKWKRELFDEYRRGNDGVSLQDLRNALEKLHVPPSRSEEIFMSADTNNDGVIEYTEVITSGLTHQSNPHTMISSKNLVFA